MLPTTLASRRAARRKDEERGVTGVLLSEECGDGRVCRSGIRADAIDQLRVEVRMLRQLVKHHLLRRE